MYRSKALAKSPHSSEYVGQLLKCCPVCPAITCVRVFSAIGVCTKGDMFLHETRVQ